MHRETRDESPRIPYLSPRDIWCDNEFHIPMPKNPQNHPPEIPLCKTAPSLEQFCRCIFLTCLILGPSIAPISASLGVLQMVVLLPALVGNEAWEDKNRFYV